ncbi:MAG: hypothetical protein ABI467_21880 [Kofleriaceae bacterium]
MFEDLAAGLSPDGHWLAIGAGADVDDYDAGAPLAVWDVAKRAPVRRRTIAPGGIGMEGDGLLRFSPSGALLTVGVNTNEVMTLDASTSDLRELGHLQLSVNDSAPGRFLLPGETALLTTGENGVAIAPARGSFDYYSPAIRWLAFKSFPFECVAARGDGRVIGASTDVVTALDPTRGTVLYSSSALPGDSRSAYGFSPDATILVGAGAGTVGFLDTATGTLVASHRGPDAPASAIVWAIGGHRVAVVRPTEQPTRAQRGDITIFEGLTPLCRLALEPRRMPWLMAPDLQGFVFSRDGTRGVVATAAGEIVGVELASTPRTLYRTALVSDPAEWLGLYACANETLVAVTSQDLIFLDGVTGAVQARQPLGFPIRRDVR